MAEMVNGNSSNGGSCCMAMKDPLRRTGNHHPNLWTDDFIQSLTTPYSDPSYHKHRDILIDEIRDMFSNGEGDEFGVLENIWFVDVVQRLGIDRHFQEEIKTALDYVYKFWNHDSVFGNLNMVALGFRILRLNRYAVCSDIFKKFKGEEGQFSGFESSDQDAKLEMMVNVYKASELDFPEDDILREARVFASTDLKRVIKEYGDIQESKNPLLMEIEYTFKYPWRCRFPRLEAWNFIHIMRQQDCYISLANNLYKIPKIYMKKLLELAKKLLELAILDFNILQSQHQDEMKLISTWWKNSSAIQLDFFRHRHIESYFWWASPLFEPEFSACRINCTKLSTKMFLLDDIYDTYGTVEELKPFTTTLTRWDVSTVDNHPDYMKIAFNFSYEIYKEIAIEAERKHGPFVYKYLQSSWKSYIESYMQEAEWIASNHIPGFDEYLMNGVKSCGMRILMIHALILMDTPLSDEILEQLDIPSSKSQALLSLLTRLVDDVKDFEDEQAHGETASSIECYMKDNHGSSREDALNYLKIRIESSVQELNKELLEPSNMHASFRNLYLNVGMRAIFFMFNDGDLFTFSNKKGIQDTITKIFVEPIIT